MVCRLSVIAATFLAGLGLNVTSLSVEDAVAQPQTVAVASAAIASAPVQAVLPAPASTVKTPAPVRSPIVARVPHGCDRLISPLTRSAAANLLGRCIT